VVDKANHFIILSVYSSMPLAVHAYKANIRFMLKKSVVNQMSKNKS
jgi:hypothetical protein